jgi:hypothetical protein
MPGGDLHRVQPAPKSFYPGKSHHVAPSPSFDERDVGSPKRSGPEPGFWPGSPEITRRVHEFQDPRKR